MVKKVLATSLSLVLMLMVAPAVMAASIDVQVSTGQQPSDRISTCPDTVLSDIDLMVTNLGGQTDTVMLSLDWPADLGFIKPYKTLASGEIASVDPFWITVPYDMAPGIYHAKVTAESSVTGDVVTKDIEVEVLRCHSVDMIIDDASEISCKETEEPAVYDIEIVNQGKWSETFDLSASVEWAGFSQDSVTIDAGDSSTVSLILSPPAGAAMGKHTVYVTARSIDSYASKTSSVELEVVDCFDFSISLTPESQSACLGDGKDYQLTVTNNGGEEDDYSISVPDWVFPEKTAISLGAGESETIDLTAVPSAMGIQSFEVSVTSARDSEAEPNKASAIISVEECRGVAVIASPGSAELCKGEDTSFSISIKNTGSVEGTFMLTATMGELSQDSVTLDEGDSTTVSLDISTSEMEEGTSTVEITAADGDIVDTADVEVTVEQCFAAELSLQPDTATICPGASVPYIMELMNTGKQADTYTIEVADQEIEVGLIPGESHIVNYDYQIPHVQEGRYLFTVAVTSENGISLLESSEITLRSSDSCYGVDLEDGEGTVEVSKATTLEIDIKNTGEQSEKFMISMTEGPDWAYVEPHEVHLGGQETDSIYLYLSPGYGTAMGTYTVKIMAESDTSSDELMITVTVPEEIGEVPDTPDQPDDNISINITHPDDGASVTGGAVEERPFWKTTAVAGIALIIVVILVMRFVLLFKK